MRLEDIFSQIQAGEVATLNLIIKADVHGSLEAVTESLRKLERPEVKPAFVHRGVGAITENDITLAAATNATLIGFNVRPDRKARDLAEAEKVEIRTYEIIYKLLEDIERALVGMLAPEVFPAYQRARMDPQYLVTDALRGWMLVHFASNWYDPRTCADEALYRGKIFFMLHRIHPDAVSRLWWDWTEEQWAWAEEHEREVWQEFSNAKELLNERRTDYLRWFNEGPFTRAGRIPQESPDQLGTYIAWRAVEDYMAAHPETTLPELLALRDPVPVFKAYRP